MPSTWLNPAPEVSDSDLDTCLFGLARVDWWVVETASTETARGDVAIFKVGGQPPSRGEWQATLPSKHGQFNIAEFLLRTAQESRQHKYARCLSTEASWSKPAIANSPGSAREPKAVASKAGVRDGAWTWVATLTQEMDAPGPCQTPRCSTLIYARAATDKQSDELWLSGKGIVFFQLLGS